MFGYGVSQKRYQLDDLERNKVIHNTSGVQKESTYEYVKLEVNNKPNIEVDQNCVHTENHN